MNKYIAAIDQGTTSTRCILFDGAGLPVSSAQKEHEQILPRPGWVEHDPVEIVRSTEDVIARALKEGGVTPAEIAAVGITNQRETTVLWNKKTGQPFCNAIVWQDTRTQEIVDRLGRDGCADRVREETGLPLATYFAGPRITWALENVDGFREAAQRGDAAFGTIDSWVIWNLTGGPRGGVHVTDVTNASRTQLFGLSSLAWEDSLLELMDVPRSLLPEVRPSIDPQYFGITSEDTPLGGGIPISGVVGDQQAALLGQCCVDDGDAKCTYGTGCFLLMSTGERVVRSNNGLLTTVAAQFGDRPATYALEGSVSMAGALVQWLRDNLGIIESASEVEKLAREVPDSGGICIVPAFSGLFAPYWRSDARGVIVGLTRFIDRRHIARAALESTAWQTRELLDAMRSDADHELQGLKVDGGMTVNEVLMQFQANVLGMTVSRPRVLETTALGAAYAAGMAMNYYPEPSALKASWKSEREWVPDMEEAVREEQYAVWKRAVERTFDWVTA